MRRSFLPVVLVVAALAVIAHRDSQASGPLSWRRLSAPDPLPSPLVTPFGFYDLLRHRVLAIEGSTANLGPHSPILVSVFESQPAPHWSTLTTLGTAPERGYLPGIAYDPIGDRLFVFGGAAGNVLWQLDLAGIPTWSPVTTSGPLPPVRPGSSLIVDPDHDRIVLFGGSHPGPAPTFQGYFSDVWSFSLESHVWTQVTADGSGPQGREGHGAMFDPIGHRMIVFGGHSNDPEFLNDLWALSLGDTMTWSELAPTGPGPTPRSAFGTVYDPVRHRMWIHSGVLADEGIEPDGLWFLPLDGAPVWHMVTLRNSLTGESYPIDVYDPTQDRLLNCGGSNRPQVSALSLAAPDAWEALLPPRPAPGPGERTGQGVAYDSRRDRFVVVGGEFSNVDSALWSFRPSAASPWKPISASRPDAYWNATTAFDSLADQLLLLNGLFIEALPADGPGAWSQIGAGLPDPGWGIDAGIAVDSRRHRLIVCGGEVFYPHSGDYTLASIRTIPLAPVQDWSSIGTLPADLPWGSSGQAVFYDPVRDRLIVVGGHWRDGLRFFRPLGARVWTSPLDSELQWTERTSSSGNPPIGPPDAYVAFDPGRDRLYLFSDTLAWSRDVEDTGPWTALDVSHPAPHVSAPVVYDPVRDQIVALFTSAQGSAANQAWALALGPLAATAVDIRSSLTSISLSWASATAIGREVSVERREGASDWKAIGSIAFDVTGAASYVDSDVLPGHRYDYRLAISNEGGVIYSGTTSVATPVAPGLALFGTYPNPSHGTLSVALTLPDARPARLELFDVRGRLCLARDIGALGLGTHTIRLDAPGLRPGVYLIRLSRAGTTRTAHAVLLR